MMSSAFTGLLLVHRLVGKAGLANLLRGVIEKVAETSAAGASATGAGTGQSVFTGAGNGRQSKSTLYVCLWKNPLTDIASLSRFSTSLYAQAANICPSVDVRLLLQKQIPRRNTTAAATAGVAAVAQQGFSSSNQDSAVPSPVNSINVIFADSGIPKADMASFLTENAIPEVIPQHIIFEEDVNDNNNIKPGDSNGTTDKVFDIVALGGTFDRIHNGHKLLLSEAVLRCQNELIIGVTDDDMIKSKSLHDLILPLEDRMNAVQALMTDIAPPTLKLRIVPLSDPYGPAITEENLGLLVASQETLKSGAKINEIRKQQNLQEIELYSIQLFPETNKQSSHEENKISSSTLRLRNLGERLRPPNKGPSLPYIIGLTGGIASGKSTIAKYLETLGAGMIDCDKLGHQAYTKDTDCYKKIVLTFGSEVVNSETGDIDRRVIGSRVFGKPDVLKQLTDIVWPEIQRLVQSKIQEFAKQGVKIVIVDAAVLIEAKWDDFCHEVWVPFIPRDEAVKRIQERDNLTAEDAQRRIDSQLSNKERLKHATFAFSSLWEVEFTQEQVGKAWSQVQDLIKNLKSN